MLRKLAMLAGLAVLFIAGCKSGGLPPPNTVPPIHIPGTDPNAGVDTAKTLMWPFLWAGFLGLIGGIVWAVIFKNLKPLMYAGLIALVPPTFFLFLKPVTPYVGWLVLASGVLLFGLLFYKVYDVIEDDLYQERKDRKGDKDNVV